MVKETVSPHSDRIPVVSSLLIDATSSSSATYWDIHVKMRNILTHAKCRKVFLLSVLYVLNNIMDLPIKIAPKNKIPYLFD